MTNKPHETLLELVERLEACLKTWGCSITLQDWGRLSRAVSEMREFIQNDAELPTGLDGFRKNAAQRLLARLDEGGGE